eukprot:226590_1
MATKTAKLSLNMAEEIWKFALEKLDVSIKNLRNNNCTHNQYKSIAKFISKIDTLHKLRNKSTNDHEHEKITQLIDKLIGKGYCKQCCLYIIVNISELCSFEGDTIFSMNHQKYGTVHYGYHSFSRIATTQSYFVHCLSYPQIAMFIFNRSMLWIQVFNAVHYCMAEITHQCKSVSKQHQNVVVDYEKLLLLLCAVIKHILLWKKFHWKALLRRAFPYLKGWVLFIQKQIDCDVHLNISGLQCMAYLYIIIIISLHKMETKWYRMSNHKQSLHDAKSVDTLRETLKKIVHKNYFSGHKLLLLCLEDKYQLDKSYKYFRHTIKLAHLIKRDEMQCQNIKCNMRRIDTKNAKLYRCKNCNVVRYCSKRCQKYDWNKNDHKYYCNRLKETTLKDSLRFMFNKDFDLIFSDVI